MAVLTSSNTSGVYDAYATQRYYEEQERRYRETIDRQRYAAMQQAQYNPYTDTYGGVTAQQIQEGKAEKPTAIKAATPEYLKNDKLLLLEK